MGEGYWERYESVVDQRIREAQERGAFDDLPGKGRPLRGLHGPDDPNWWLRSYLEREGLPTDALLPTPLRLRKEVERLPETVRDLATEDEVRAAVGDLNRRVAAYVRHPTGPRVSVRPASVEEIVAGWRAAGGPAGPAGPRGTVAPIHGTAREGDADDPVEARKRRERRRRRLLFRRRDR